MSAEFGVYGNVVLKRGFCAACDTWAIILVGKLQCCDAPCYEAAERFKRIVEPEQVRRAPSIEHQRRVIGQQGGLCLYCDQAFGDYITRKGKLVRLHVCWDHQCPWTFSQDNTDSNFVASCQLCNAWKYNHIFNSVEAVREFVAQYWSNSDEALPRMRRTVRAHA